MCFSFNLVYPSNVHDKKSLFLVSSGSAMTSLNLFQVLRCDVNNYWSPPLMTDRKYFCAVFWSLIAASSKEPDMAVCMLVSVKSVIKGYHVYRVSYPSGTKLVCNLEPENEHSDSAIIVKRIIQRRKYCGNSVCYNWETTIGSRRNFGTRRWAWNSMHISFIWTEREKKKMHVRSVT